MSNTNASYTGSNVRTDKNARCLPSRVKTGSVSVKRSDVASITSPPSTGASRIWRRGSGPGCDQASQRESGEKASPPASPSAVASTWRTSPDPTSTSSTRPS